MEGQNGKGSGEELVYALVGGAILGFGAALLLAPKSGRETRESLKGYAQKVEDEVAAKVKDITSTIDACQRMCQEHLKLCKEQMKGETSKACCS